jgi:outer membrane biosynthesis protein TonB
MDPAKPPRKSTPDPRQRSLRGYALLFGSSLAAVAVLFVAIVFLLRGEPDPPRKVPEITVVHILPPPPPPPRAPPPPVPEQKMVEQTPVKNEIKDEKPIEPPKTEPIKEAKPAEPPPGPLSLAAKGEGPGDLFNLGGRPGGRGLLGGGGGGGSRWGWYATIVQTQIEAALRANPKTRNAIMQVQVRLWCDGAGRVNRVQLVSSTGDSTLDTVVRNEILQGLVLREPPPKDMPMPILTRITERKAG